MSVFMESGEVDEEAFRRVQLALTNSPIYALRMLRVESDGDAICLRGRVGTFYHKQLAQEAIRMAAGKIVVVNSIDVEDEASLVT